MEGTSVGSMRAKREGTDHRNSSVWIAHVNNRGVSARRVSAPQSRGEHETRFVDEGEIRVSVQRLLRDIWKLLCLPAGDLIVVTISQLQSGFLE